MFGASLAIISTIIGGGIISVPYAFTAPGFANGMVINLTILCFMLFTTYFYLKAKDYLGFSSISELSYICFGRASVFVINFLLTFVIFWDFDALHAALFKDCHFVGRTIRGRPQIVYAEQGNLHSARFNLDLPIFDEKKLGGLEVSEPYPLCGSNYLADDTDRKAVSSGATLGQTNSH